MAKIEKVDKSKEFITYKSYDFVFFCPGCKRKHGFNVTGNIIWEFNGDMLNPTVSPSINSSAHSGDRLIYRCHSFVKDGKIQFLSDCTHELAGQTVELPEIE
jgi:hypothetical protein